MNSLSMPVIMAPIIGLLGLLLGQWLAHRFSIKREVQKYTNEIYQEFFAKILFDLLLFYDTRTAYRRNHDINFKDERSNYRRIIKSIEDGGKYLGIDAQMKLYELSSMRNFDQSVFSSQAQEIEVFRTIISEGLKVVNSFLSFDIRGGKQQTKILRRYLLFYDMWYEYIILGASMEYGSKASSYRFMLDDKKLNNRLRQYIYYKLKKFFIYKRTGGNSIKCYVVFIYKIFGVNKKNNKEYFHGVLDLLDYDINYGKDLG